MAWNSSCTQRRLLTLRCTKYVSKAFDMAPGAKKRDEIYQAFDKIYPVLLQFKKDVKADPPPLRVPPAWLLWYVLKCYPDSIESCASRVYGDSDCLSPEHHNLAPQNIPLFAEAIHKQGEILMAASIASCCLWRMASILHMDSYLDCYLLGPHGRLTCAPRNLEAKMRV